MKKWKRSLAIFAVATTLCFATMPIRTTAVDANVNINTATSGAVEVGSSYELTQALSDGVSSIRLTADILDAGSYTVVRGVVLDGDGHRIVSAVTNMDTFKVQTSEAVAFQNVAIDSAYRAVTIYDMAAKVTLENVMITAAQRGVTVYDGLYEDGYLEVMDSVIQQDKATLAAHSGDAGDDYDTAASSDGGAGNYRGLSLYQVNGAKVDVTNTVIQGFWVAININGADLDATGTVINVKDSTLKGRAGINVWSNNATINVDGSHIHGINNFAGPTENFANIVLNSNQGTKLNISDTAFTTYQNEVATPVDTSVQRMIANRAYVSANPNVITISGETSFTDAVKEAGKNTTNFEGTCNYGEEYGRLTCPVVEVTGGTFDYDDVRYFVDDELYDVYEVEGKYVVAPITEYAVSADDVTVKYGTPVAVAVAVTPEKVGAYDNPNLAYAVTSSNVAIDYDKTTGEVFTTSTTATSGVLTFTFYDGREKTVNVVVEDLKAEVEEDTEIDSKDAAETTKSDAQTVVDAIIAGGEETSGFEYEYGASAGDIIDAVATGDGITTAVNADEIEVSDVEDEVMGLVIEELNANVAEAKVAKFYDVGVALLNAKTRMRLGRLTELTNDIKVTVALPDDLGGVQEGYTRTYYMVRHHDGVATVLPVTDNGDGTVSFKTRLFSTYMLAYTDTLMSESSDEAVTPSTGKPDTGAYTSEGTSIKISQLINVITVTGVVFITLVSGRKMQLRNWAKQRQNSIKA